MKNNNKIDELFREELSSYSIPLTFSTLPIITAAVKKNLFYKFSFLKFNIYYATILATGSVGGISYGAIKMYENSHQQEIKHVIKAQNNTYKTTNDSLNTFKKEIVKSDISGSNNINHVQTSKKTNTSSITENESTDAMNKPTQNEETQTAQTILSQSINNTTSKDTNLSIATPKRVVYIKQEPVKIIDTVIKVIKRKK